MSQLTIADRINAAKETGKEAEFLDGSTTREFTPAGLLAYIQANFGGITGGATAAEINNVADVSARVQTLTASGAVTAGVQSVQLSHISAAIAATLVMTNHPGLLVLKNTSASGSAAHTVTVTGGTLDGTNTIATLDAPGETLVLYVDSVGNAVILVNIGSVGLS